LTDSCKTIYVPYTDIRYILTKNFYTHAVMFAHLQYYGDSYGISAGYILNIEEYRQVDEYNNPYSNSTMTVEKTSQGGGLTFYLKTADSSIEISGEFHLLADTSMNFMTISKFGVRAYF